MTWRPAVFVLDALAAILAVLAGAAAVTGGFIIRLGGARLSLQSPTRALVLLAIAVLIRSLVFRRVGLLGFPAAGWRRFLLLPSGSEFFQTRAAPGVWRRATLASLGLGLAVAVLLHDVVLHPYSVPDWGDPLFSIWRMGWVIHALFNDPSHLFDGNIFYPLPLTLTLSDAIVLPALLGAPLRALGLHPVIVYNLLLCSAFWLSGIATYLLVERLTGSARAAFIAGLVYATYSFRFDHYSHLELQMTYWMPLGLLALHLLVSTGRWPYAVALALAGVAQLYSGMYFAVFFLVYAAVIGVGLLIVYRPPLRGLALSVAGAAVLAAIMALPLVRAFIAAEPMKGERTVEEIQSFSAVPIDYARGNPNSAIWRDRLLPAVPERSLFPGAAPLTLAAAGLAPPLGAMRLVYGAGLFLAADGSMGLNGVLYPYFYRWLAPFRGLRAPARFGALVGLTLAIFSGFGALRLLERCRARLLGHLVLGLFVGGIMVDAWPAVTTAPVWKEPPPVYAAIQNKPGVVLAEFPVRPNVPLNSVYMYFSLWHWMPMINGYSGFIPRSYTDAAPELENFPLGKSVELLRRLGVTHVTVNCGVRFIGLEDCDTIIARIQRTPDLSLVTEARWEGARVALYELRPVQSPQ